MHSWSCPHRTTRGQPAQKIVSDEARCHRHPVSHVDRTERCYGDLGWRLDIDYADRMITR